MSGRPPLIGSWRRAVALVALTVATMSCGIQPDGEPQALDDLPDELFSPSTSEQVPADANNKHHLPLYFYSDLSGQMVRIDRPQESRPTIQDALNALTTAPTPEEQGDAVYTTKLPPELAPTAQLPVEQGLLLVVVDPAGGLRGFQKEGNDRAKEIFSQIVCTVLALDDDLDDEVEAVQIWDQDGVIPVVGREGASTDQPVAEADFNECLTGQEILAEQQETTTTTR